MAESSGFFADVSGDREYTSDWLAKYISSIVGNGTYDGELGVTADGNTMSVTLPSGRAWINGYYYRNDCPLTLAIDNADGILNRKDIIVLRWDVNARSITAQVIKGTPASNAVAPVITRNAEQHDLKLAEISIPAGTTAITQSMITDCRLDKSVCGIVTGAVTQVDTTTLYNQIQADLAEFKGINEAQFTAWFNNLKNILNDNTAGNLQNEINKKADKSVLNNITIPASGWQATSDNKIIYAGSTLQGGYDASTGILSSSATDMVHTSSSIPVTAGEALTINYSADVDVSAYATAYNGDAYLNTITLSASGSIITVPANCTQLELTVKAVSGTITPSDITCLSVTTRINIAPYMQTVNVEGVTATSANEILPALGITQEQLSELQAANLQDGGQTAGNITLKAFGEEPSVDLPVRIIVRGDM